jgi:hypothetical protein
MQWVRLSALDAIYEGRRGGTNFVDLSNVAAFLDEGRRRDLYAEIAEANQKQAQKLGFDELVARLQSFADEARRGYASVLEQR